MLIVYCGELWPGSTCRMRLEALRRLGHEVVPIDTCGPVNGVRRLLVRVAGRVGWRLDTTHTNYELLEVARQIQPDVVWIDKGLTIRPATLRGIRNATLRGIRNATLGTRLVHYSLDDMTGRHNQSRQYLAGTRYYDLHVTNKSYNVPELKTMGARSVLFVNNAFCPKAHRPVTVSNEERLNFGGPVGFIGAFEKDRAEAIWPLLTAGVPVRVWGEEWGRGWKDWAARHRNPNLKVEERAVFGHEYAKAICSFDINLAFLRKLNRDAQTTRSIEIPACGGFMLAERTQEHLTLFEEGGEAEFFGSHGEMLEKCRYYLAHAEERTAISRRGRERCVKSGYSYDAQLKGVLAHLDNIGQKQ